MKTGQLYPVAKAMLHPASRVLWPTEVRGLRHLPSHGGAIIAANHLSFLDSALLIGVLPRRTSFIGKAEYLDSWKTRTLFPAIGMIPVDRSGGRRSLVALDAAAELLERGELFGIFPEGTRSRDGLLHRGRTGAARLALRTGAPLVPVGIVGTDRIQPPDARAPKLFRTCSIRIGAPIEVPDHRIGSTDPRVARQLTDDLMYEIGRLSGQTYVDRYAERPAPACRPAHEPLRTPFAAPQPQVAARRPVAPVTS
jgi:1-acyl-sn-glycerol-3-phosphate acyltransferase